MFVEVIIDSVGIFMIYLLQHSEFLLKYFMWTLCLGLIYVTRLPGDLPMIAVTLG